MPDLHTRLLAEIERREGIANAATNGPWNSMVGTSNIEPWKPDWRTVYSKRGTQIALMGSQKWDARNADFVAANDPPTVLAYLAALREVVEIHAPMDIVMRVADADGTVEERAEPWCSNCEWSPYPCATTYAAARALGATP